MRCRFEMIDGTMTCAACGLPYEATPAELAAFQASGAAVLRACHPAAPSLLQKGANLATATARHIAAGSPQCTAEQIAERLKICHACPSGQYKPTRRGDGECMLCGCPITARHNWLSKIAWTDQSCPAGHWGAENG